MRSIDARIKALEQLAPAPNIRFVVNYRTDGSVVPLAPGDMWTRNPAFLAEPCRTTEEWLKLYGEPALLGTKRALDEMLRVQRRAMEKFNELATQFERRQ
jgi:hypothetical protein